MSTLKKYAGWLIFAIIVIVVLVAYYSRTTSISFVGASPGSMLAENYDPYIRYNGGFNTQKPITTSDQLQSTGSLVVGSSGTSFSGLNFGTCYIGNVAATITASSSVVADCQGTALWQSGETALAGITSSDSILATFTSSSTSLLGLNLSAAIASTTPGYIQVRVTNMTGGTYTWPTGTAASGTVSYIAINP